MQDIKTDFYKRHGRDGGIADSFFCPASVCIFRCETAEVGLSLSFGAHTAYRKRSDGRIILSRTDSNIKESVNQIDIDRFKGAAWAEEIINAVKKLPSTEYGAEILMHTDVGEPSLAPQLLCAVSAFSKLCENSISPQNLISLSGCTPYQLASLTNSRIAAANTATLDYMTYNPTADGKKIIVIKTGKKHKPTKLPKSFYDRELSRINSLSGSFTSIGELMFEASRDM
ncbi:MAG: hypothetical protein IJ366_01440, partial [Clostridia bacterium]|nr:hypothetical protein [Clostridia bacterium]